MLRKVSKMSFQPCAPWSCTCKTPCKKLLKLPEVEKCTNRCTSSKTACTTPTRANAPPVYGSSMGLTTTRRARACIYRTCTSLTEILILVIQPSSTSKRCTWRLTIKIKNLIWTRSAHSCTGQAASWIGDAPPTLIRKSRDASRQAGW